jgi:hypothetical protein
MQKSKPQIIRRHFGASLESVHIVDNQRYESRYDHSIYSELSRVVARHTADLEYFCLHQFGKNVAHAIVLAGSRADQLEHLVNREQIDLIMLPRNHQRDSSASILVIQSPRYWLNDARLQSG